MDDYDDDRRAAEAALEKGRFRRSLTSRDRLGRLACNVPKSCPGVCEPTSGDRQRRQVNGARDVRSPPEDRPRREISIFWRGITRRAGNGRVMATP